MSQDFNTAKHPNLRATHISKRGQPATIEVLLDFAQPSAAARLKLGHTRAAGLPEDILRAVSLAKTALISLYLIGPGVPAVLVKSIAVIPHGGPFQIFSEISFPEGLYDTHTHIDGYMLLDDSESLHLGCAEIGKENENGF